MGSDASRAQPFPGPESIIPTICGAISFRNDGRAEDCAVTTVRREAKGSESGSRGVAQSCSPRSTGFRNDRYVSTSKHEIPAMPSAISLQSVGRP